VPLVRTNVDYPSQEFLQQQGRLIASRRTETCGIGRGVPTGRELAEDESAGTLDAPKRPSTERPTRKRLCFAALACFCLASILLLFGSIFLKRREGCGLPTELPLAILKVSVPFFWVASPVRSVI
jgi:hypothetical protein